MTCTCRLRCCAAWPVTLQGTTLTCHNICFFRHLRWHVVYSQRVRRRLLKAISGPASDKVSHSGMRPLTILGQQSGPPRDGQQCLASLRCNLAECLLVQGSCDE